eukprot:8440588-Alexandrium_andersonii.AAC.1
MDTPCDALTHTAGCCAGKDTRRIRTCSRPTTSKCAHASRRDEGLSACTRDRCTEGGTQSDNRPDLPTA